MKIAVQDEASLSLPPALPVPFSPIGDPPIQLLDVILMLLPHKDARNIAQTSRFYRDYLGLDFWIRWCTRNKITMPPRAYIEWIKNGGYNNFYQHLPTCNPLGSEFQMKKRNHGHVYDLVFAEERSRTFLLEPAIIKNQLGLPCWVFQTIRPSFLIALTARNTGANQNSFTVLATLYGSTYSELQFVCRTFQVQPRQMEWSDEFHIMIEDYPYDVRGLHSISVNVIPSRPELKVSHPVCRLAFPSQPRNLGERDFPLIRIDRTADFRYLL